MKSSLLWSLCVLGACAAAYAIAGGNFALGAVCAAFAVAALKQSLSLNEQAGAGRDDRSPPEVRESEPVAILLLEFALLGGLVLYYRRSIFLELLSLVALMGSFSAAYVSLLARIRRVANGSGLRSYDRVIVLTAACALASLTTAYFEVDNVALRAPIAVPFVVALIGLAVASNLHAIRLVGRLIRSSLPSRRTQLA